MPAGEAGVGPNKNSVLNNDLSMFITNDLIRTNTLIQVRDRYLEGMTQDENSSLYGDFGQPNRNMYTVIPLGVVVNNIS